MMARYRDNPDLKAKVVKTIDGTTEYRKNCRKIGDKYYVVGEQCFEVDGKWYASTSKLVTLDHETGKYVLLKTSKLVYGLVGFKPDGTPNLGYFSENIYNNCLVNIPGYGAIRSLSEEFLEKNGCIEEISSGLWRLRSTMTESEIVKAGRITSRKVFKEKGYNIEDNKEEFQQKKAAYENYTRKKTLKSERYARFLEKTTFGCEFESAMGILPDHIQNRTGVVICRDGSIDNAEFVTVPMKGAKGLLAIKDLCLELSKRTTKDIKCAFHVHLGSIPDDRLFLVALYALAIRIQDDVFTMFPYYKTDWKDFKKKNYCQKLRKLGIPLLKKGATRAEYESYVNDGYYRLFKWLSEGNDPDDLFNRRNHVHPRPQKWERAQRYYWINFMNMFFSDRKTMEFRVHQATTNHHKAINWIFICNAVINYARTHAKEILSSADKITLDQVIGYYAEAFPRSVDAKFLTSYLQAYVKERKEYFKNDKDKGDYESAAELKNDPNYTFSFGNVEGLV